MTTRRVVFWSLAAAAALAAGAQAWLLRWTCDDAYISLRYAEHFVQGHGLVFNLDPGEAPVEGYTNFAWTMLLALGYALGITGDAIELWSNAWGVLCHVATVLLLAVLAWRTSGGRALVPIAACCYAAIHHAASLAPAGLETALFVLLTTAMLRFALFVTCAREAWLAGFLAVLAAMTRPDGGLLAVVLGGFVLFDAWRRPAWRLLVGYCAPFLLVFVPYLLWRHAYYGQWVPNTFFAKSAHDPYPGQGLVYVWEFVKCYAALLPVALVPLVYALRRPGLLAALSPFLGRRPFVAVLAFVLPYLGFVVWVGGDFMFGRFLVPILPPLLLALDLAANRWANVWPQLPVAAGLVAALLLRHEPAWLGDYQNPHGFSDNRAISVAPLAPNLPITRIDAMRHAGHALGALFAGLDVRIGIGGSHANLAHRSKVPVAVECVAGLTDAYIAHLPIAKRSVVGHERGWQGYVDYLVDVRRLHIHFDLSFATGEPAVDPYRDLVFPTIPARLVTYDRKLLQELRRREPNLLCADFEAVLDRYLAELPQQDLATVRRDYQAFTRFYFAVNDDPVRRSRFEEFLR